MNWSIINVRVNAYLVFDAIKGELWVNHYECQCDYDGGIGIYNVSL